MGREVRRVPVNWEHPEKENNYIPLHDGSYPKILAHWILNKAKWEEGLREDFHGNWVPIDEKDRKYTFEEWYGEAPKEENYMPDWPEEERTHYQMYETCTEGTPISPVMVSPEELARWLTDNGASAFGSMTATYEQWLKVCKGSFAPSAALINGHITPGVAL